MTNNLTVQNQDNNNSLIVNGINDNSKVWGEITIADIKESNIGIENREILLARFNEQAIKDLDANMAGNRLKEIINLTTVSYTHLTLPTKRIV